MSKSPSSRLLKVAGTMAASISPDLSNKHEHKLTSSQLSKSDNPLPKSSDPTVVELGRMSTSLPASSIPADNSQRDLNPNRLVRFRSVTTSVMQAAMPASSPIPIRSEKSVIISTRERSGSINTRERSGSASGRAMPPVVGATFPTVATPESIDRPRTLPPKRDEELQKHMKEYEEISKQIKRAMEKEAKDKEKLESAKSARLKKLVEFRKVWQEEILPDWDHKSQSKKAQDMWRIGLHPSIRGQIWQQAIGNELMITQELYNISRGHAKQTKEKLFGSPEPPKYHLDGASLVRTARGGRIVPVSMDELLGKEGTTALVSILDLPTQFPARELFGAGGPMHDQFAEVLEAYAAYRPDVGYVPAMAYLVAGLLLNMETFDAFVSLANFINKPFNLAFYITDRSQMYKYTSTASEIIATFHPKIIKHLKEENITLEPYLNEWFMTIYLQPLPFEIAVRVWDMYLLEGEIFLFKVALALLKMHSHQFESYPKDMCLNLLDRFPRDLSEETLFETIAQYNLDAKKLQKLLE